MMKRPYGATDATHPRCIAAPSRRLHAGGRLPEERVEEDEVDHGDEHGEEHHGEAHFEEVDKRDVGALHLGLGRHDNVGGGADEGAVAAKARAEGESPGEGADGDAFDVCNKLLEDGDHCCCEGDVVDKGREDGRGPHDDDDGDNLPAVDRHRADNIGEDAGDGAEQAKLADALDHNKKGGEEEKRVPLDSHQCLVAVVHVKGDEEPDGAEDRDKGGVDVGDGVQEEAQDDASKHHSALYEQPAVCDGVRLLERGHVGIQGTPQILPEDEPQVAEHEWCCDEDTGGKVDEKLCKVDVVAEEVADDDVGGVANHGSGAAHVGEDCLGDEVRAGVNVDELAQLASHWGDEEDGSDVVEEG
mmetsp:Transcript_25290/g.60896  ORF Transcript_25290/g.60896 Transcript_25290/m.60896 type:complete len:358 (-) Transcript_25290:1459-2532(-)